MLQHHVQSPVTLASNLPAIVTTSVVKSPVKTTSSTILSHTLASNLPAIVITSVVKSPVERSHLVQSSVTLVSNLPATITLVNHHWTDHKLWLQRLQECLSQPASSVLEPSTFVADTKESNFSSDLQSLFPTDYSYHVEAYKALP